MALDQRSEKRLEGVNPALVDVVRKAAELTEVNFIVTEGIRTKERQAQLLAKGASRTMNSKHLIGRAVDLAAVIDGEVRWDWPLYHKLAKAMKDAAAACGVKIVWGGDWRKFKDGPHFELP